MTRAELNDEIGSALERGVDTVNRVVYLFGEVDTDSSRRIQIALRLLDRTKGKITLHIDSVGGDVFEGFAIYDAVRMCKNSVYTYGTGAVMSMAAAILQAGKRRILTRHARVMVHNGSWSYEGEIDRVKNMVQNLEYDRKLYQDILATRATVRPEAIAAMCKEETFLTSQQALEMGFVDEIVG